MKKTQKIRDYRTKLHQKLNTILTKRSKWKLYIWLFIGVCLSIMPLFYQTTFEWYIGYYIEIDQILPDYVLVAFAITGNLLGLILDSENLKIKKWFSPVMFFLVLFFLLGIILSIPHHHIVISNNKLKGLFIFTTIYMIVIVILGAFFIIKEGKDSK